jgi:HSP20 family protein
MTIFRWPGADMFSTLRSMRQDIERLMGREVFADTRRVGGGAFPPVNVLTGPDDIVVECEMPGVQRQDIEVSITGETLVIRGTKIAPAEQEGARYQRRETGAGQFSRTVVLPDAVKSDSIEAKLADGILTVRLPKAEQAKPKQIQVK